MSASPRAVRGLAWWAAGLVAAGVCLGAGAVYWAGLRRGAPPGDAAVSPAPARAATSSGPATIVLTPEAAARAGITLSPVASASGRGALHVPGRVEANAYTQVALTAVAASRVTAVRVGLGDVVTRGQILAQLYSPEVAEQQRIYLSMRADFDAAHAKLLRTERLVEIGSVSQQELEASRAEHTRHASDVESARARLRLLGISATRLDTLQSPDEISADVDVTSPLAGVVTRRDVNVGQTIETGANLFAVVDLSTVWVIADLFEQDAAGVRVGSPVTITSAAVGGRTWTSRVSYIDPQVAPETRTVRARADVPNADGRLRFGMYVDVAFDTGGASRVILVPTAAVQTIQDRRVVYVGDAARPGHFVERAVRVGRTVGDRVEVVAGLSEGESVVTDGSFYLRAERDRLGLPLPPVAPPAGSAGGAPAVKRVDLAVTPQGFVPDRLELPAGEAIELRVTRRTDETCAKEIVVPSLGVKRALPLNRAVVITIPPQPAGTIEFACGMNMLKGTVVVR